jgi:hypothetical protein
MFEQHWHGLGEPYYKVAPSMVEALMCTRVDIDCKFLKFSYPVVSIRLPQNHVRNDANAPWLRGVLCTTYAIPDLEEIKFIYAMDFRGRYGDHGVCFQFTLQPGKTLEECFYTPAFNPHPPPGDDGYWPTAEFQRRILGLVVGTLFFAIGGKLTERDRPSVSEGLRNKKLLKKSKGTIGSARKGYVVGQDILLPKSYRSIRNPFLAGEGNRLTHGHIRCGHLRWQPHGPRGNPSSYELIFIAPTVVRPDLPLKPKLTDHVVKAPSGRTTPKT